jgi:hypothetical protein
VNGLKHIGKVDQDGTIPRGLVGGARVLERRRDVGKGGVGLQLIARVIEGGGDCVVRREIGEELRAGIVRAARRPARTLGR